MFGLESVENVIERFNLVLIDSSNIIANPHDHSDRENLAGKSNMLEIDILREELHKAMRIARQQIDSLQAHYQSL